MKRKTILSRIDAGSKRRPLLTAGIVIVLVLIAFEAVAFLGERYGVIPGVALFLLIMPHSLYAIWKSVDGVVKLMTGSKAGRE